MDCGQPSPAVLEKYLVRNGPPQQLAVIGLQYGISSIDNANPKIWVAATPAHPFFLLLPEALDLRTRVNTTYTSTAKSILDIAVAQQILDRHELLKKIHERYMGERVKKIESKVFFEVNQTNTAHKMVLLPGDL